MGECEHDHGDWRDHLMTPPYQADPAAPVHEPITYTGADHLGEYLLTIYGDGAAEFAFREQSWETWSPPVKLTRSPVAGAA